MRVKDKDAVLIVEGIVEGVRARERERERPTKLHTHFLDIETKAYETEGQICLRIRAMRLSSQHAWRQRRIVERS